MTVLGYMGALLVDISAWQSIMITGGSDCLAAISVLHFHLAAVNTRYVMELTACMQSVHENIFKRA